MKNIDRFTFFSSYHEATKELSDRDRKAILVAIVDYVFENKTPEFKGAKKSIWSLIVPHLEVSKSKSSNAKKDTEKKSKQNQNEIKTKSNENQSSTCPLSEKEEGEEGNKEVKKGERGIGSNENQNFPPTLTQILNYASEIDFEDEEYCEKFYNHYSGIGWVNGAGREIIDWKSVFKNWIKKDEKENKSSNYQVGSTKGLPEL